MKKAYEAPSIEKIGVLAEMTKGQRGGGTDVGKTQGGIRAQLQPINPIVIQDPRPGS